MHSLVVLLLGVATAFWNSNPTVTTCDECKAKVKTGAIECKEEGYLRKMFVVRGTKEDGKDGKLLRCNIGKPTVSTCGECLAKAPRGAHECNEEGFILKSFVVKGNKADGKYGKMLVCDIAKK